TALACLAACEMHLPGDHGDKTRETPAEPPTSPGLPSVPDAAGGLLGFIPSEASGLFVADVQTLLKSPLVPPPLPSLLPLFSTDPKYTTITASGFDPMRDITWMMVVLQESPARSFVVFTGTFHATAVADAVYKAGLPFSSSCEAVD